MNRIIKHINFHYRDFKKGILIFWGIILGLFLIFTLGARIYDISLGVSRDTFAINIFSAIIVILIISSYEVMNYSFPHLIGISSTRKDYWLGKTSFFFILAFVLAATQGLILILEYLIVSFNLVSEGQHFLFEEANFLIIIFRFVFYNFTSFFMTTAIFSLFFTIAYRMGKVFYIILGVIAALMVIILPYFAAEIMTIEESLAKVIETVIRVVIPITNTDTSVSITYPISLSLYYLLISIPLFIGEYILLRKAEVK
ncbi:hypothetical protein [Natronospora cellulosivora (SeqCode)]